MYVENPPPSRRDFIKEEVKRNLRNSFPFVPDDRFEWVNTEFTNCNVNEFNIKKSAEKGAAEYGQYLGNANCKVFYDAIWEEYHTYAEPKLNERAGKIAAHEMGHSLYSTPNHHEKCVMTGGLLLPRITDLPDGCLQFCDQCKKQWEKRLGKFD